MTVTSPALPTGGLTALAPVQCRLRAGASVVERGGVTVILKILRNQLTLCSGEIKIASWIVKSK